VCEFDDVCASAVAFAQVRPVRRTGRLGRPLKAGRASFSAQFRAIFTVLLLMPRYFFDLFFDRYVVLDPGGMLFDRKAGARGAAREMARHLAAVRPELRNGRGWIRVRDIKRNEVHRLAIDPEVRPDVPAQRRTVTLIAAE
jgi:hypothetical protein